MGSATLLIVCGGPVFLFLRHPSRLGDQLLPAFFVAVVFGPVNLTPDDLSLMAKENALRADTIRIVWDSSFVAGKAVAEESRAMLALMSDKSKISELPADIQAKVAKAADEHRQTLRSVEAQPHRFFRQDYWSDRENFQMRAARDESTGSGFSTRAAPANQFPDLEATRDRLPAEFSDFCILSLGAATGGKLRAWDAQMVGQLRHSARLMRANNELYCYFPPLAFPKVEWGGKIHPIDEFIARFLGSGQCSILGEFQLDGEPTLLVDAEIPGDYARAFLDLRHAAMPRRIEFFNGAVHLDSRKQLALCSDVPGLLAARIVKDVKFNVMESNGVSIVVPVSGIQQTMGRSSSPDRAISPVQPDVAIHEEMSWKVDRVEIDRVMSEENFKLTFPPNTVFVNEATNELMVTGDAEGYVERLVQQAAPPRSVRRLPAAIVASVVALTVGIAALWLLRRGRMSK